MEGGAGAVARRHSAAHRLRRRGALRPAQRHALRRAQAAAHDRPDGRAGAAEGRAACRRMAAARIEGAGGRTSTRWRDARGLAADGAADRHAVARARSAPARPGRPDITRSWRARSPRTARRSGCWAGRTRRRLAAQIAAAAGDARARPHRHRSAQRHPGARRRRRLGHQRFRPDACLRRASARRRSRSSARPARGTGSRSIRSPPSSSRPATAGARSAHASKATTRCAHHRTADVAVETVLAAVREMLGKAAWRRARVNVAPSLTRAYSVLSNGRNDGPGTHDGQTATADTTATRAGRDRIAPCARSRRKAAASTRSTAALRDGLGAAFAAAIDLIRAAQGRVIVTGMGKSGHVGAQDRLDLRLDRHAGVVRASGRSEPRRPRHDHQATTSSSRCRGRARRRS